MANGKEKIKKMAKFAYEVGMPMGQLGRVAKGAKKVAGRVACQKKGGKWVGGKCIPKGSTVRTGKKKYPSRSPKRSIIHYRPKIKE